MRANTVEVDTSERPTRLRFAPRFNVAVPFIDRHVSEGRGERVAIRTTASEISYRQLAENVGRCANALVGAGLGRGERLLMVVKDCPAFFYLFWGDQTSRGFGRQDLEPIGATRAASRRPPDALPRG